MRSLIVALLLPVIACAKEIPQAPLDALFQLLEVSQEQVEDAWLQKGKERWNFAPIEEEKRDAVLPLLEQLDCIQAIHPSRIEYDYALIVGGFHTRALKRIQWLVEEYNRGVRFKEVVLLTGERYLDRNTSERDLPFETEAEMMLHFWQTDGLPLPCLLVNAPQNQGRPGLKDTLRTWLQAHPEPGRCLLISSQPYIGYHDSVAKERLPSSFSIETVGLPSVEDLPIAVYLDNLARWIKENK